MVKIGYLDNNVPTFNSNTLSIMCLQIGNLIPDLQIYAFFADSSFVSFNSLKTTHEQKPT